MFLHFCYQYEYPHLQEVAHGHMQEYSYLSFDLVYYMCVETNGKSLEEIDVLFGEVSHAEQCTIDFDGISDNKEPV